jgi:3-phenylpropionate/trans-cinnamate dioxygenase ferredoxin reductase subunit
VVIAGASFIGMEAASSLRARGLDVTVVAPEEAPFARTLGVELGGFLWSLHEEHGVRFALGSTVAEVREREVVLDDGSVLPADLVLLGVGVRPLVDLAATAGLDTADGVEVDAYLETRIPGIFAAGDIARFPDARTGEAARVEHWVVAQRQGQTAARNILGRRVRFDSVPFFWTHQYDVRVSYTGHAKRWDREERSGDARARDFAVRYVRDGAVLAVATVGRDQESLQAEVRLEHVEKERAV